MLQSNFGLGNVDEEERICCRGKQGCKKRNCCTCIIIFVLLDDLSLFIYTASLFACILAEENNCILLFLEDPDIPSGHTEDSEFNAMRYINRIFFSMLGTNIICTLKLYSGLKWLKRRDRNSFIAYYRLGMTYIGTMMSWLPV